MAESDDETSDSGGEVPREYGIEYTDVAWQHLKALKAYERRIVVDGVDEQLLHQPATETRKRKRLRPNPLAAWELRIGDLRVLYDVDAGGTVLVVAIGKKHGNRLEIGGEDVEL